MKLWPPVTFPDAYSTITSSKHRETSLWKSWKHTILWFPGGSSHCRSWSAYRQQCWWHWCFFEEEIMTLFCANNMTSNIQHGVTSHYPSVPGEPQPRAFRGWKLGWVAPQAYRGFYNGGGSRRGGHCSRSGRQVPQWGSGAKFVPQKLKKKCEISLQLLTFSCIKFGI